MVVNWSDPVVIAGLFVVGILLVIAVVAYVVGRKKNSAGLRKRFGSEYDLAVLEHGSEHKAESKLAGRETRVEKMKIRDLSPVERERYLAEWATLQARFIDHPKGSVTAADELIAALMQARGYPVAEFDQRAEDISVGHPRLMEYYRTAHAIAVTSGSPEATTEEQRAAMIQYRAIFDELVKAHELIERKTAA